MDTVKRYEHWLEYAEGDALKRLKEIGSDPVTMKELFGRRIDFGTAGIRGIMDVGTNRVNNYTVAAATQALSEYIVSFGQEAMARGVCIAYDNRHNSRQYSELAAGILCKNGVKVYLFDALRPTPELSFSILAYHAMAGINITASHNTKEYNGYKVYWEDAAQISPETAVIIAAKIENIDEMRVASMSLEAAAAADLLVYLGKPTDDKYIGCVLAQTVTDEYINKESGRITVVYTPFHGTGCRLVPEILHLKGYKNLVTVNEQMVNDPDFFTVKSPNPENTEGFALAIDYAKKCHADIIIGTDPDADRAGTAVLDHGEYRALTGNQIGALLLDYIITERRSHGTMPPKPAAVKSIVSTELAKRICDDNGIALFDVLTGFKYIGEKISEFEKDDSYDFIFGFEESNGYLSGCYARDKDAVAATMLIAEMACKYKAQGIDLRDKLKELYKKYGFFEEKVLSKTFIGPEAQEQMTAVCDSLRSKKPDEIAGIKINAVRDYKTGVIDHNNGSRSLTGLPSSDVLYYELGDGSALVVRPSGTEPKIKVYLKLTGESEESVKGKFTIFGTYVEENIFS